MFRFGVGLQTWFKGMEEDDSITPVITVLDEIQKVDGILKRVVEERESSNGELIEVSRSFFAFCRTFASVFPSPVGHSNAYSGSP